MGILSAERKPSSRRGRQYCWRREPGQRTEWGRRDGIEGGEIPRHGPRRAQQRNRALVDAAALEALATLSASDLCLVIDGDDPPEDRVGGVWGGV